MDTMRATVPCFITRIGLCAFTLLAALAASTPAHAGPKSKLFYKEIPLGTTAAADFIVTTDVKWKDATLHLKVEAPPGTTVRALSSQGRNQTQATQALVKGTENPIYFYYQRSRTVATVPAPTSGFRAASFSARSDDLCGARNPDCHCYTEGQINKYVNETGMSREEFCSLPIPVNPSACNAPASCGGGSSGGNNGGGSSSGGDGPAPAPTENAAYGVVHGSAYLYTNRCAPAKKLAAGVRVTVPAEYNVPGQKVLVWLEVEGWGDRTATSVKARGAGKYSGPLLLMAPVYSAGYKGDVSTMEIATFNRGKVKVTPIPFGLGDTVYYGPAGGALWRAPLKKNHLSGGCGTFVARNGPFGYSHDMKRVAADQFRSYPKINRH